MEDKEKKLKEITLKERKLVDGICEGLNQTQAYMRAYPTCKSVNTAKVQSCRVLKKPNVRAYYNSILEQIKSRSIAKQEEIMIFYTAVMRGEIKDQFGLDPSLDSRIKGADSLRKIYGMDKQNNNSTKPVKVVVRTATENDRKKAKDEE